MKKDDVYEKYMDKVRHAFGVGYRSAQVIGELQREKISINLRKTVKQAELAGDRNIYKTREAAKQARECIAAIDRICKELEETQPKESSV